MSPRPISVVQRRSLLRCARPLVVILGSWGCVEIDLTGPPLGPFDVTGSWIGRDFTDAGVPSAEYDILQEDSVLTGETLWRWQGALERVGSLSGIVRANGRAQWTTTLDDNGWNGRERVDVRFEGVELEKAGTADGASLSGLWEWRGPSGELRNHGTFSLDRADPVLLPEGTGVLGEAGRWRGAMLYESTGECDGTGFVMTVSLSGEGEAVSGSVSARPQPRGGDPPGGPGGYLGYMAADVSGVLSPGTEGDPATALEVGLSGDLEGTLSGTLTAVDGASRWVGTFRDARPCVDNEGGSTRGTFVLQSERPLAL